VLTEVTNIGLGDATFFRIGEDLAHRITDVSGVTRQDGLRGLVPCSTRLPQHARNARRSTLAAASGDWFWNIIRSMSVIPIR